jgi:hypothetical protein
MKKLSTGQPSTLGSYKKLAKIFGNKAVAFIQSKIDESPNGESEEVLADERQMLQLLGSMIEE